MIDGAATSSDVPQPAVGTQPPTTTAVFGMLVFLASDLMLFAGFFAAYFMLRGESEVWPPQGVDLELGMAAAGTAALVISSLTLYMATRAVRNRPSHRATGWLALSAAFGAVFLFLQVRDYLTIDFSISTSAYGAIYWTLTALAGLHVLVGIGLILLLMWRMSRATSLSDAPLATTAYFWHMVVAVSVVVFLVVFILQ